MIQRGDLIIAVELQNEKGLIELDKMYQDVLTGAICSGNTEILPGAICSGNTEILPYSVMVLQPVKEV